MTQEEYSHVKAMPYEYYRIFGNLGFRNGQTRNCRKILLELH